LIWPNLTGVAAPQRESEADGDLDIDAVRDDERRVAVKCTSLCEGKSERSIRMKLSLAFVAPPIAATAIKARPPRGFGARRLMDLSIEWSKQQDALGLTPAVRFGRLAHAGVVLSPRLGDATLFLGNPRLSHRNDDLLASFQEVRIVTLRARAVASDRESGIERQADSDRGPRLIDPVQLRKRGGL
jgi:hypothetical protein